MRPKFGKHVVFLYSNPLSLPQFSVSIVGSEKLSGPEIRRIMNKKLHKKDVEGM